MQNALDNDPETRVWVGAMDWRWPGWRGGFYPDDMPVEWWLTYYNTQFNCVWVPVDGWIRASAEELAGWREDTHAGFRFLLESPECVSESARGLLVALAPRVGCVCHQADPGILWFDAGSDPRELARAIPERAAAGPLALLSRDGDLATLEKVKTLVGLLGY